MLTSWSFCVLALLPIFWTTQARAGLAEVSPTTLEIGVVRPNSSTSKTLTLNNNSADPIKLLSVDVSCTMCTHVTFTPTTVAPGKTTRIQVSFTPPASEDGPVHRSITVHTSAQADIKVPLTAYVTDTAGIWPLTIDPGTPQSPGSDVTSTFDIINVSDQPLTPLYVTGPVGGPKLEIPHTPIAGGARATLHATWHVPAKAGTVHGQIVLFVDHPTLTKLVIPYQCTINSDVPATSPALPSETSGPPDMRPSTTHPTTGANPLPAPGAASQAADPSLTPIHETASTPSPQTVNLNLTESVPLKDFVEIVSTQLKLNLIYDDNALNVPVSIRLSGPLPIDALLPLLKTILQAKGLALVNTDRPEIWRIVTSREAQSLTEPGLANGAKASGNGGPGQIVTEFITPKSIDLETAAGLLRGFLTPNAGQLTSVPRVNALIVTDYSSQLARLHRLMDLIDKPQATAKVAVVPIKSAEAAPLADRVTKLLGQIAKTEGRSDFDKVFISPSDDGAGIVLVGPEGDLARVSDLIKQFDTAPSLVRVDYPVPDQQRTQALDTIRQVLGQGAGEKGHDGVPRIVTAPQRLSVLATEGQHRRIKDLLTGTIDNGAEGGQVQLRAYRIENRDAGEIYATLTRLMGDNRGGPLNLDVTENKPGFRSSFDSSGISHVGSVAGEAPPAAGIAATPPSPQMASAQSTGSVNITIDQGTNTLLVAATNQTHQRIEKLIRQLDQKQAQVLMEVMLVSVSDSETFTAAVDAAVKATFAGSTLGIGTNNSGIGTGDFVNGRTPVVVPGLNAAIFNPASFSVFLQALQTSNKARIMSEPQVLALDNKPALLQSTQEIPYTSVNASTTVSTTSFGGFAEAGTTLEITPHIAPGEYLNMEYRLEVSSFTGSSSAAGVPPPKQSDAITSFVSVPDGSTVVLGGLRSSNNSHTVAKVPGLGEIPILGWIGRNQSDSNSTAAFYVFVRPTILRSSKFEDLKGITKEKRRDVDLAGDYPETKVRFLK